MSDNPGRTEVAANSTTRRVSVTQRADGSFDMTCADCGGYGGHWTHRLMPFDAGWSIPPDETQDGMGYAMCLCMVGADTGKHDPTGANHMEEMWEHAHRADAAEAVIRRIAASDLSSELAWIDFTPEERATVDRILPDEGEAQS